MGILKNEIMRAYDLRPSTVSKAVDILEIINSIAKAEYERGLRDRPKGEWLEFKDPSMWTCSNCDYRVMRYNNTKYCPNCGAEMWNDK